MTKRDLLTFDDTDFKLTKGIGIGIAVLTAAAAIIAPLVRWASGDPLVIGIAGFDDTPADGAKPGVTLTHDGTMVAEFAEAGPGAWLASIAPAVLFLALVVLVLVLLWRLLDDVRLGQPFSATNVRRMRGIAAVIVVGAFAMFLVQGFTNAYLIGQAVPDSTVLFAYDSSLTDLVLPGVGFLIAALAEAFKHGVALEDEVEGLV